MKKRLKFGLGTVFIIGGIVTVAIAYLLIGQGFGAQALKRYFMGMAGGFGLLLTVGAVRKIKKKR